VAEVRIDTRLAVALDWTDATFSFNEAGILNHATIRGFIKRALTLSQAGIPLETILRLRDVSCLEAEAITSYPAYDFRILLEKWTCSIDLKTHCLYLRNHEGLLITIALNRGELRKVDLDFLMGTRRSSLIGAELTTISTDRGGRIGVGRISECIADRTPLFISRTNINYLYDGGCQLPREDADAITRNCEIWWCEATRTFYVNDDHISRIIKLV